MNRVWIMAGKTKAKSASKQRIQIIDILKPHGQKTRVQKHWVGRNFYKGGCCKSTGDHKILQIKQNE